MSDKLKRTKASVKFIRTKVVTLVSIQINLYLENCKFILFNNSRTEHFSSLLYQDCVKSIIRTKRWRIILHGMQVQEGNIISSTNINATYIYFLYLLSDVLNVLVFITLFVVLEFVFMYSHCAIKCHIR